jgi:chromosome segregation ATPase
MDNSRKITKKIDWLDEQRRKDRKLIAELQEQLLAALNGNQELKARMTALESGAAEARELLKRVEKVDDLFEQHRSDFIARLETAEAARAKSEREGERLRQLERETINKSLVELGEALAPLGALREEVAARKEEEHRFRTDISETRRSVESVARIVEESEHLVSSINESRRQDGRRIAEFGSAAEVQRQRMDELKPKLESLQDASLRNEKRTTELTGLETERKLAQNAWMEQQEVTHAERERWSAELQRKSVDIEALIEASARKLEAFGETHREMKQALSALDETVAGIERRLGESAEVQRVNYERLQDEWNSFEAEEQKKRVADMLLRDELWREHDRKNKKNIARLEAMEKAEKTTAKVLQHLRSKDYERLKNVFGILREFMSEHDQDMKKVP